MTGRVKGQNRKHSPQTVTQGAGWCPSPRRLLRGWTVQPIRSDWRWWPCVLCLLLATLESFRERRVKFMNKWALLTELYSPLSFTVISIMWDIGIIRQWATAKKGHFAIFLPEVTFCCFNNQGGWGLMHWLSDGAWHMDAARILFFWENCWFSHLQSYFFWEYSFFIHQTTYNVISTTKKIQNQQLKCCICNSVSDEVSHNGRNKISRLISRVLAQWEVQCFHCACTGKKKDHHREDMCKQKKRRPAIKILKCRGAFKWGYKDLWPEPGIHKSRKQILTK